MEEGRGAGAVFILLNPTCIPLAISRGRRSYTPSVH